MKPTPLLVSFLSLSLSCLAAAQTSLFLPKEYERAWGRDSALLLGSDQSRTQLVYASQFAAGTTVMGIRLRQAPATTGRDGFTADVEIHCSSGPSAPGSLSATFANNVGSDERLVFRRQPVDVPRMKATRGTGAMAEIRFNTPFVFGLNGNTNLVIDVSVFGRSAGAIWSTDLALASPNGRTAISGSDCGAGTVITWSNNGTFVSGDSVNVALAFAPANSIALLAPSFDLKELAPGVLLPFDLSRLGAGPGCALMVDPSFGFLPFVANAAGVAIASIQVPPAFGGVGLGFQWLYLVPASPTNPVGVEATASSAVWIGPEVCLPSFQAVWDITSATSATGNATTDAIPVAELIIQ